MKLPSSMLCSETSALHLQNSSTNKTAQNAAHAVGEGHQRLSFFLATKSKAAEVGMDRAHPLRPVLNLGDQTAFLGAHVVARQVGRGSTPIVKHPQATSGYVQERNTIWVFLPFDPELKSIIALNPFETH